MARETGKDRRNLFAGAAGISAGGMRRRELLRRGSAAGDGYAGTDDQLLEEITKTAFQFFWEQADATTGQIKDRALAAGNDTRTVSSIASTGFGLTALCIGDQR